MSLKLIKNSRLFRLFRGRLKFTHARLKIMKPKKVNDCQKRSQTILRKSDFVSTALRK